MLPTDPGDSWQARRSLRKSSFYAYFAGRLATVRREAGLRHKRHFASVQPPGFSCLLNITLVQSEKQTMRGDNMTTAEIRQIRERLNLTQVEFARELGVCQGTVSHWEKGIRTPTGPAVRLLRILASANDQKKRSK